MKISYIVKYSTSSDLLRKPDFLADFCGHEKLKNRVRLRISEKMQIYMIHLICEFIRNQPI